MQIKLKKANQDGIIRLESRGEIKEILINEDMLQPQGESISICYRGKDSSGIIDFSPAEIAKLNRSVKERMHLIKGFRKLKGKGFF